MYFDKPPLVELIAELRWLPVAAPVGNGQQSQLQIPAAIFAALGRTSEHLYMRFAGLMGANGFLHSERLMPQGFPALVHKPMYRYSKSGTKPGEPVFQLGPGIFSAHITPPYKSWDDFRPFVETGVTALLDAREGSEHDLPFTNSTVRYMDCFTEDFLGGKSTAQFVKNVLGIEVTLPGAISRRVAAGEEITPAIQLMAPLPDDRQMDISLANGQIPTGTGLIMNSSVSSSRTLPADKQIVMQFLDGAHQVISDMFVELTTRLHPLMEPRHESRHV